MGDADDSDIGEAVEALDEILRLKAGVAQLDLRGTDSRFVVKTLKALARKARRTRLYIERPVRDARRNRGIQTSVDSVTRRVSEHG